MRGKGALEAPTTSSCDVSSTKTHQSTRQRNIFHRPPKLPQRSYLAAKLANQDGNHLSETERLVRDAVCVIAQGATNEIIQEVLKGYPHTGTEEDQYLEEKFRSFVRIALREYGDLLLRIDILAAQNSILILVDRRNFLPALKEELQIFMNQRVTFEELLADERILHQVVERYRMVGEEVYQRTLAKKSLPQRRYYFLKYHLFRKLEQCETIAKYRKIVVDRVEALVKAARLKLYSLRSATREMPKDLVSLCRLTGKKTTSLAYFLGRAVIVIVGRLIKLAEKIGRSEVKAINALYAYALQIRKKIRERKREHGYFQDSLNEDSRHKDPLSTQ